MESKFWEDVSEGQSLPVLEFPITIKTLAMAVAGTRDFAPYHHNSPYTKSIGSRDMFANTMFEQALFGRYSIDWSGPESDFRQTTLQMVGQVCPGDLLRLEGTVARKYQEKGECRVFLEMTGTNSLGIAARSSSELAMPSRTDGPVRVMKELAKPKVDLDPNIPDFARPWIGEVSEPTWGPYPISEVQIMYWCDMVRDENPLYVDGDYARSSRHAGVIAPPMALWTWRMNRPNDFFDVDLPAAVLWPGQAKSNRARPNPPDAPLTIATKSVQEYGLPLRPGDRIYFTEEVVNCSGLKRSRLGPGYFLTTLDTFYNQRDEIVGWNMPTVLKYRMPEGDEAR